MERKSASNLFHNSKDANKSARKGAMKNAALYLIDGEYVNAAKLVEVLNMPKDSALAKLRVARQKPGPLTWAKLGVVK